MSASETPRRRTRGAVLRRLDASSPFAGSTPLTIEELALAAPVGREVLVRIEAASVCHSDLSVVEGLRPRPTPMLLGHESAGIVEEVGPDVVDVAVGERVVMTFLPRCGDCAECATNGRLPCSVGTRSNERGELIGGGFRIGALPRTGEQVRHHLGVSGFATRAVVDERSVVVIEHDVPADVAAVLGCAVLTGGGAVMNVTDPGEGASVVVVGLGGVGMAAVLMAVALNYRVTGIDGVQAKRDLAVQLGAEQACDPETSRDVVERADLVIDATGNARGFETAVSLTAPGGTTVTVGLPPAGAMSSISPLGLVAEARTIVGSYLGSAVPKRDIPKFISLWREGKLPIERLISSEIRLDQINEAMDALAAGEQMRQIVRFEEASHDEQ
ncbi:alcohol dehydrogenase catalytic domain-containing protein [Leucobacter sp. L43]|uniref:zinc-binding dehydrogenase n=1 Tax=Leucobacter sp. L43 TaxID=2798040 RepID=UPI00190706A1|nr:alcohol dehydrogenase catalytic domain-containing protein [Leucobacter sp. L43]